MNQTSYFSGTAILTLVLAMVVSGVFAVPSVAQQSADDEEPDESEIRRYYSLYLEDYRNEDFEHAIPNIRWMIENAPMYADEDARHYNRMVQSFVGYAEQKEDDEERRALLDSALVYIDRALEEVPELGGEIDEYRFHLERGRIIQSHSDIYGDRMDESAESYRKAYELGRDRIDQWYLDRLIRTYLREDMRDEAIAFMEDIGEHRGDEEEIREMLDEWGDRVFRSPEERIAFLESRVERDPEDVELLTELFDLYVREGHSAEAEELAQTLLELDPSARVYRLTAEMRMEEGDYERAYELYQEAVALADEPSPESYYNMGVIHQQLENPAQARDYFLEAADVDPEFGQAYFAIADLYASTVSRCSGAELERRDRAVYWLVVDYYERARQADPSLENQANQNIQAYRAFFPDSQALFFQGWEPGQSYSVDSGCYSWINETTTVRAQ